MCEKRPIIGFFRQKSRSAKVHCFLQGLKLKIQKPQRQTVRSKKQLIIKKKYR